MSKSTIRFAIWIAVGISIAAATLASVCGEAVTTWRQMTRTPASSSPH